MRVMYARSRVNFRYAHVPLTSALEHSRDRTGTCAITWDLTAKMQLVEACLPLAVLLPPLFAKQSYMY